MDKRTATIVTIVAAVLCGCPGLIGLCLGGTSVLASFIPNAQIDVFGSNDPRSATTMGFVFLCLSLIFIAIPIVIGFVTLRKKPGEANNIMPPPAPPSEPLPPAS